MGGRGRLLRLPGDPFEGLGVGRFRRFSASDLHIGRSGGSVGGRRQRTQRLGMFHFGGAWVIAVACKRRGLASKGPAATDVRTRTPFPPSTRSVKNREELTDPLFYKVYYINRGSLQLGAPRAEWKHRVNTTCLSS